MAISVEVTENECIVFSEVDIVAYLYRSNDKQYKIL